MPSRTQMFKQFPWVGGVNTALDEAVIASNELTRARNLVFGTRGSRKKRDGINFDYDDATNGSAALIASHDFWFGTSTGKSQLKVTLANNKTLYSYNGGTRSTVTIAGTTWASAISQACMITFYNLCIIGVDGSGNVMKKWKGSGNADDLGVYRTTGDVNYLSTTGNTNSNNQLSGLASTTGIVVGSLITGTGIPANTVVNSILGTTVTMNNVASTTATGVAVVFTSTTIRNVADTIGAATGATVTGAGIPAGTYVTGVSGSTVVISASATAYGAAEAIVFTISTPPQASIMREHQGRVWTNDKTNVDRLHYCSAGNAEEWQGIGDSGALDIGIGDGDPEGITGIFPTFKGQLFVAKRTRLYRVNGDSPENYSVEQVSSGIGCVSHDSIAQVDEQDMVFASDRGFHSLAATQDFGDFDEKFLSKDIQTTFNENFVKARRKFIKAAYDSKINSIMFAVTDSDFGETANNCLWLYNLDLNSWYTWPNISCESLALVSDADAKRVYIGGANTRLAKTANGTNYDVSSSGGNIPILLDIYTGLMFPTGDVQAVVGFKKFFLFYRPRGTHTITVTVKIDNYPNQSFVFSEVDSSALLGSTFILGSSSLGYSRVLGDYGISMDGFGQGIKVRIQQSGTDEEVEIQGFAIEYEQAGTKEEVLN